VSGSRRGLDRKGKLTRKKPNDFIAPKTGGKRWTFFPQVFLFSVTFLKREKRFSGGGGKFAFGPLGTLPSRRQSQVKGGWGGRGRYQNRSLGEKVPRDEGLPRKCSQFRGGRMYDVWGGMAATFNRGAAERQRSFCKGGVFERQLLRSARRGGSIEARHFNNDSGWGGRGEVLGKKKGGNCLTTCAPPAGA